MTYFYAGRLRELKYQLNNINNSYNMGEQFKALGEIIDILVDTVDPPDASLNTFRAALNYKSQYGLDGLHFFKFEDCGTKYFCVTADQYPSVIRFQHLELIEKYDIDQMFSGCNGVEFSKTGRTYYSMDDLKHDWLALKLSGVERE